MGEAMASGLKKAQREAVIPENSQQKIRSLIGSIRVVALNRLSKDQLEDIGQRLVNLAAECFDVADDLDAH